MTRKVSCVVPARLASNRFPGKMLHPLQGTPIVVHTLRRAKEADCFDEILCLTDSKDIRDAVLDAGFRAELTGPAANGTERIGKYHDFVAHELIVNLQGDEPAFPPQALRLMHRALTLDPEAVHVLVHDRPATREELGNPNRCKVALDEDGRVLDIYRAEPHVPLGAWMEHRLQMGSYGYGKHFVRSYADAAPSGLELSESHELLRDLAAASVRAHICPFTSQAVDVPEDAAIALALLRQGLEVPADHSAAGAAAPGQVVSAERPANMAIIAPFES
jgi:3-deoxy-manno-octulosonate cytidylyltransferase (CMP-KDO synthetase)